jgi:tRNA (cytidine/uridine-2'-O-)-methyltransferase
VMDYWERVELHRHVNYGDFRGAVGGRTVWMLTTRAERSIWDVRFAPSDVLLFGPESRGLPEALLEADPEHAVRIPMLPGTRSLNLGSSVAVALYEVLRQTAGDAGAGLPLR